MEFIIKYWIEFAFGLIITAMGAIFRCVLKQINKQKAIEKGVQALLRNELIRSYESHTEKGSLSILDRENINHMYEEYKNLGGNGTVKSLIEDLLELPTK